MSIIDTKITVDGFGFVPSRESKEKSYEIVQRYTLTNKTNASIRLISWGAGIQSISVPNAKGILGDVLLGFDNIDGYLANRYIGRTFGRDKLEELNNKLGLFDYVNWDSYILDNQVVMTHVSNHDNGGKLFTQIKYSWTDENELCINIRANSTRPAPVDITNYYLFNLAGHGMGSPELTKHVITMNADEWRCSIPQKNKLIAASSTELEKKIFDMKRPTLLDSKRLRKIPGGGYDHFFRESGFIKESYRFHARVLHPESGRFLEVYSNQPGFYFYTANKFLRRSQKNNPLIPTKCLWTSRKIDEAGLCGKGGHLYEKNGAFLISPCHVKAVMNSNDVSSNILHPGHVYYHNLIFKFGVKGA